MGITQESRVAVRSGAAEPAAPLVQGITLALCTHNHSDRLRGTLESLRHLHPPACGWELLVIDNASTDATPEMLAREEWRPEGAKVRVVREDKLGLSNARNRAIAEAAGDYIVFIDDDETPDPGWLAAYADAAIRFAPDAMGGPIDVLFVDGERPRWLQDELLGFLGRLNYGSEARWLDDPSTPIFGGNFAFRRSAFDRIGEFDAGLGRRGGTNIGGEDTEIYERLRNADCKVRWVANARIFHRIQATKLKRSYFLDLHYQYGRTEGQRARGQRSRIPPAYLLPQLGRAVRAALTQRIKQGGDASLRKEMNVAYFIGYLLGWSSGSV